jgi:hypothetical protein
MVVVHPPSVTSLLCAPQARASSLIFAPEVQNSSGDIVEHGQAQVGVGGQTDDISGRDLGAVGGVSGAGAGVEFGGADSDDDGDG